MLQSGWLDLSALCDSIFVYIKPSSRERERERERQRERQRQRNTMMSKQPPPALTANTVGPCPIIIEIVGRPGTENCPAQTPDHNHPGIDGGFNLLIRGRNRV